MNRVKCSIEECPAVFETEEPLSASVRYVCRLHTPAPQESASFQGHQFDHDMNRAGTPVGTAHIPHREGTPQPEGFRPSSALKVSDV
jgi:hypothetical protein